MKSLRDSLKEWTDIDGAQFELAKLLGLIATHTTFQDTKHLWWTYNDVGSATACLENDAGLLERRHEPDIQYRWAMRPLESLMPRVEKLNNPKELHRITTIPVKTVTATVREPFVIEGDIRLMDDKEL